MARFIANIPRIVVALLLVAAIINLLIGVFLRYVMIEVTDYFDLDPVRFTWVEEVGEMMLAWLTLVGAATREAHEESGIEGLRVDPVPLWIGVHPVTCSLGVPTRHLDVEYLAVAPAGAQPVRSDESLDLAWFPVGALPDGVVADLPALLARGIARAKGR